LGRKRMLKDPSGLSFRGAEGDEESRKALIFGARFLEKFIPNGQSEIPRFARNDSVESRFPLSCWRRVGSSKPPVFSHCRLGRD